MYLKTQKKIESIGDPDFLRLRHINELNSNIAAIVNYQINISNKHYFIDLPR